ncbi:MAG: conjugal transfer protein [Streptosporangiaceae bacterium]
MVRRATLERGERLAPDDEAPPGLLAAPDRSAAPARAAPRLPRRRSGGSGGRWLVWVGRVVVWALLLLIGYRGVLAIVTGIPQAAASPPAHAAAPGRGFPVSLAQAYALGFGGVYLSYNPADAAERASELARYLPPGTDAQLGWNGAGSQRLQSEQVASVRVQNAHQAVITLLAQVSGRLIELGVPVYASGGGLVVSGEPALLPAPARAAIPQSTAVSTDPAAQTALLTVLPSFFQAYASGDQATLARFLAPGAHVTGLGGTVTFGSISQITVPRGGGTRQITVSVTWRMPPGTSTSPVGAARADVQMTYQLTVVRHGGIWDVASIGAAAALPGPP